MCLHAFTGCDTTSSFRGIGKVKPVKLLEKENKYEDPLSKLGAEWTLDEDLICQLEDFTCTLYGCPRS